MGGTSTKPPNACSGTPDSFIHSLGSIKILHSFIGINQNPSFIHWDQSKSFIHSLGSTKILHSFIGINQKQYEGWPHGGHKHQAAQRPFGDPRVLLSFIGINQNPSFIHWDQPKSFIHSLGSIKRSTKAGHMGGTSTKPPNAYSGTPGSFFHSLG